MVKINMFSPFLDYSWPDLKPELQRKYGKFKVKPTALTSRQGFCKNSLMFWGPVDEKCLGPNEIVYQFINVEFWEIYIFGSMARLLAASACGVVVALGLSKLLKGKAEACSKLGFLQLRCMVSVDQKPSNNLMNVSVVWFLDSIMLLGNGRSYVQIKTCEKIQNHGSPVEKLATADFEAREVPAPIETKAIDGKAIAAQVPLIAVGSRKAVCDSM